VTLVNSVFGTLFLSALLMLAADIIRDGVKEKRGGKTVCGILLMLAPVAASGLVMLLASGLASGGLPAWAAPMLGGIPSFLTVEGGFYFPLMGLLFYLLRKNRPLQLIPLAIFCVALAIAGSTEWMAVFAAIPMLLYNGRRGKGNKYFFYIFYPAHIYVFYIISWAISLAIK
jgi:hypothetical protein